MKWILLFIALLGVNFSFWIFMGIIRRLLEIKRHPMLSLRSEKDNRQPLSTLGFLGDALNPRNAIIAAGICSVGLLIVMELSGITPAIDTLLSGPDAGGVEVVTDGILWVWGLFAFLLGYFVYRLHRQQAALFTVAIVFQAYIASVLYFLIMLLYAHGAIDGFMEYYRTLPSFDAALPLYTAFYLSSLGVIAGAGIEALVNSKRQRTKKLNPSIKPHEVAAIVAAHNEELSIANTINALKKILPTRNIYIGSDASTDKTVEIAASLDVNVADIWPNRGKARVLVHLLRTYNLFNRYKAIMIIDADAAVSENYLQHALPLLDDPEVAAVAGHGVARWKKHWIPTWAMFFIAYRVRLWRIVQYGMRYGQTWKHFNMSYIIPGSPSMYRASVLRQLEIDAPGLIIEDFNMTFEVHKKKLGKIAYSPNVYAVHQDPYTLKDYIKQLKRWNLGFWQTWRRHKIWPSAFVVTTNFFMIELAIYSILLLAFPFFLIYFFFNSGVTVTIPFLQESFTAFELLIGILLFDYVTTVIAALLERKPQLLFYGLGFIFLRYIDAAIYLWSIPAAFIVRSDGRWASPQRHAIPA